ncbi:putative Restriction endonuclease S subunits [Candidatus Methylomirabilis oxygeniifera]|uniref:Putative Restriction endonuclease S subunits n=1 Tax=Methylomirabilis oxygeniifera TaxID=671143 RepID=D5MGZ6_METO1|nr:putative Restriction endonuclease S subunits [Candidatus Methylomirabilis oxyfera]
MVPLARVIGHRKEFITVDDLETYKRCRVQLHAQGIVLRDIVSGSEIKTKKQQVCRAGEFLVAEIDAKVGGFGIVPDDLDGAIVSNHYFLFQIDHTVLDCRFLDFFIRTPTFRDQVAAQGSTNYAAIRPNDVLGYKISLPPLEEQWRLVARIEELAAKIEQARDLRREAVEEAGALLSAASRNLFVSDGLKAPRGRLEHFATRITKGESPEWQGFTYQELGPVFVRSENVGWGTLDLSRRTCIPEEFHHKLKRSQLQPGDVLINLVGASIGRSCVVPADLGEANVNQAVAVISPDSRQLDSNFLMHFLISAPAQTTIHSGKVETARPNISLGDLRNLILPVPPLFEQQRIVAYLDNLWAKVDALKRLQAATNPELGALLPSVLDKAFKGEL